MKKLILLLLVLAPFKPFAQYRNLYFEHLNVVDGLPEPQITALYQDKPGYIWIGTQNGLARYDGYRLKVYKLGAEIKGAIKYFAVEGVVEAKDGALWVEMRSNGLFRYNRATDTFENFRVGSRYSGRASGTLPTLATDDEGNVWLYPRQSLIDDTVDYIPVSRLNIKSGAEESFPYETTSVVNSKTGTFWLATDKGLVYFDRSAHEIQNPLNFVNNFSEINTELIDELQDEIDKGDYDEAKALAVDIKENQQKINQHGKRADFIVKGMLQHSRTSTGEKQVTNINVLADEFFKLSYHGLRAKDKNFNAELVTHFDPDLPPVNIVQQDIGRVLLNLFNNAFYAVAQKQKTAGAGYKPAVSVATSMENGQVVIHVKDNGVGIPDAIKEKIMQPFFTTKPTGEGTGLGLSLTYDMVVKGHGGSIQVDSLEGEGSEFTISLPIN